MSSKDHGSIKSADKEGGLKKDSKELLQSYGEVRPMVDDAMMQAIGLYLGKWETPRSSSGCEWLSSIQECKTILR